jgi:hypothetical protein
MCAGDDQTNKSPSGNNDGRMKTMVTNRREALQYVSRLYMALPVTAS